MEDEEISQSAKEKKLEREIEILRYQNNRLLKYLRLNKLFYRQRLEDNKIYIQQMQEEIKANRAEIIIRSRKNENISN